MSGVGFASFEIPKSGLTVNQRGLDVTGHNIANVNTPGYTRQQAMITTGPYQNEVGKNGSFQLGLGADISQIRQIRHTFLDNVYRQENTTLGYWESRNKTFQDVQSILGDPMSSGLQNVMDQFWDSWQELSKQPDSLTVRALVKQRCEAVTQQINHVGLQLDQQQSDINSEVKVRIDEVNQLTGKIANLNVDILKNESYGDRANDLRDQRNTAVDGLSKLVNVEVNEMQDGQLAVTLGGYFLVTKGIQTKLYAGESSASGLFYVPKLEGTNTEVPLKSGIIKGIMESRGEVLGSIGSTENGSPYTKEDINFVIDISDTSAANLNKIKANITGYLNEINRPGVDYNLNLLTFDGSGTTLVGSYGNDSTTFTNDLNSISATGDPGNDFTSVANTLEGLTYRQGANKYALVFTGESIEGDGGGAVTDPTAYITGLKGKGIKTSIITDSKNFDAGDPASEIGWSSIASGTGGKVYDINSTDFKSLMTTVAMDNVNDGTSLVNPSNNILPDVRKRLNALINIMAREVNNLHKSGKALNGDAGQDFFTVIDSTRPIEMGNIKLNDNLINLNNIVASKSGDSGDNTIAQQVANLRQGTYMNDVNRALNLDEYYQSTILSIGTGGSDADRITQNQQNLVNSADSARQAITGVSMDEEMTNMMKYKYGYEAASKVINAIDQMLETVISRLGLVGR
jgi:flagellar hook-associated protein 1